MAKDKIRLGIIGCGGICRNRHLTGLTQLKRADLDNFEVTAVCDTVQGNVELAVDYLRRTQDAKPETYLDWEEMIQKAPVDAVDICLPHGLHHIVGIAALDAGLHVVVEKPYTVTVKTGRQLAEAADRAGKVLATAVPHRRMPGQRAVHWAINEGKLIGEPRMFLAHYTRYRPAPANVPVRPAQMWRRDRIMGGGGPTIDSGFHFLDTQLYFYGDVESVYAQMRTFQPGSPVFTGANTQQERENTDVVTFTFKNGMVGSWVWSWGVPGKETRNLAIYGTEGSIEDTGYSSNFAVFHQFMSEGELRRTDGTYLSMSDMLAQMRNGIGPERTQQLFPNGVTDHFAIELWDFLDAVEKGRKPEVDGWDGLKPTALGEAIYESAFTGQVVKVDDVYNGGGPRAWVADIDEYWDEHKPPKLTRG